MTPRLLRPTAVTVMLGMSRSAVYEHIARGLLPTFVKLGERAVALPEHEVAAVIDARIAGQSDAEIMTLVKRIVADRANRVRTTQ